MWIGLGIFAVLAIVVVFAGAIAMKRSRDYGDSEGDGDGGMSEAEFRKYEGFDDSASASRAPRNERLTVHSRCILVGDAPWRKPQGQGRTATQAPDGSRRARPERRAVGGAPGGVGWLRVLRRDRHGRCNATACSPISRGGRYTLDNVVPACRSCNASKCNDEVTGWLRRKRLDERAFLLRHLEIGAALTVQFPAEAVG